jgi:hypothetical protein
MSSSFVVILARCDFSQRIVLWLDGCFSLLQRVTFLCLPKEQVTKRNAPQLPLFPCATRLAGRPSKLNLAAHTKRELLRDSDSRWPKAPVNPALLGASDGDPEHHATATVSELKKEKRIWFLKRPNIR